MENIINIARRKQTINTFRTLKEKLYHYDLEITNLHIRKSNNLSKYDVFDHNDAFIGSEVIYKVLNNIQDEEINYHGLSPEELYEVFRSLKDSNCFFKSIDNRYVILTSICVSDGDPILVILEVKTQLRDLRKLKINKIITVYPKRGVDAFIESHSTELFKK